MKKSNKSIVVIGVFLVAIMLSIKLINNKREEVYELDSSNNLKEVESKGIAILYKDSDNENYKETDNVPVGNYEVDTNESYCLKNGSESRIQTTMEYKENKVYIKADSSGLKCFVYLKKIKLPTAEDTLGNLGIDTATAQDGKTSFTGIATDADSGLFKGTDDYGTTYYYRGNVTNNWIKFGKTIDGQDIYWRIIRINGNGTIRLIYSGIGSAQATGIGTQINGGTGVAFNTTYNDNKYVGYMYGKTSDSYVNAHKNEINSTILNEIVSWYNGVDGTNLPNKTQNYLSTGFNASNYGSYLDGATGFCSDRRIRTDSTKWWSSEDSNLSKLGWGNLSTAYAPFSRIMTTSVDWNTTQTPVFTCGNKKRDLFTTISEQGEGNGALTVPVGLITADEVIYAGGFGGKNNTSYYLCTNQYYWTMSPFNATNAQVFYVHLTGWLHFYGVNNTWGVRPVINLKADTPFESGDYDGTSSKPFTVKLT